jgi:hypothetical protein
VLAQVIRCVCASCEHFQLCGAIVPLDFRVNDVNTLVNVTPGDNHIIIIVVLNDQV